MVRDGSQMPPALAKILFQFERVSRVECRLDSRLREDLGLDSLQLAVLTVKIEAEFGVDVFADGVVTTVGEIEDKIRRHQAKMQAQDDKSQLAADQSGTGPGVGRSDVEDQIAGGSNAREQRGE